MKFKVGDRVVPSEAYRQKFPNDNLSLYKDMIVSSIDGTVWPINTESSDGSRVIEASWFADELELVV